MSERRRSAPISLRQRLVFQLLAIAAVLAVLLYLTVRTVAGQAAESTQDSVLGAAATAIAEQLRASDDTLQPDLPYSAFSLLGSVSQERVFYRIEAGGATVTGYDDLPLPESQPATVEPVFYTMPYRDTEVRIAAIQRTVLVQATPLPVTVLVAQTRLGQAAIAASIANRAAGLGLGFFVLALLLALISAGSVLRPIDRLAQAVARRGPTDLRTVDHPTPRELVPLVGALNGFIARLRAALTRTETFIAEAAHHIRTPLATVRTQTEIALRQSEDENLRKTLRSVIRAVEESSRSASQLLDHATVVYRSDRLAVEPLDLAEITSSVVRALGPTAELKDMALTLNTVPTPVNGDRLLLESAVRNMLDNAIKYSADDTTITLDVTVWDRQAMLCIADRGRGVSGLNDAQVATRFARGDNVADIVGSGLGLTIIDEVAAAHGGRFVLAPREGGGTCATLCLPLR